MGRPWHRPAAALALLAGLALGGPLTGSAQTIRSPADFEMKKGENSPGPVTFSHDRHRAKVNKCTTCHMQGFRMQRGQSGPITLEAKQEGKYCGACHDGKRAVGGAVVFAIDDCERCHRP